MIISNNNPDKPSKVVVTIVLILFVFIYAGCTSRQIVPIAEDGSINAEQQSITKTEDGVTITVSASGWGRASYDFEAYITPFYIVIQNNTANDVEFDYKDIALFDDLKNQYNPVSPDAASNIVSSTNRGGFYGVDPFFSFGLGFGGFNDFYPFGFSPFFSPFYYPYYDYAPYYYPTDRGSYDILAESLIPGSVRPNANLQGFVYFNRIPKTVERVTLELDYKVTKTGTSHKLEFPFVVEKRRGI